MVNKKVFISGVSGIGKTTLANFISKRFELPYIKASAELLYEKYSYINNKQEIINCYSNPITGLQFQWDLLELRYSQLKDQKSFVTDRSFIDNLVYFLLQCTTMVQEKECEKFIRMVYYYLEEIGGVILYLPLTFKSIEDNKIRIPNLYYQRTVDMIFSDHLFKNRYKLPSNMGVSIIATDKEGLRKKIAVDYLKHIWKINQ